MHAALKFIAIALVSFIGFCFVASIPVHGVTIAEVAEKIKALKPQERINYLLKGAQAEGEMIYYGTLPINEFLPLARVFNQRYRSIALHHYFSPRDGILSRTLTEARGEARVRYSPSGSELRLSVVECQPRATLCDSRSEPLFRRHV